MAKNKLLLWVVKLLQLRSLGTPLSTITIIAHDLIKQFKGQKI